jgi:hypothetical protein
VRKQQILKWAGLLLIGPVIGITGAVLYENDIAQDTAGLMADQLGVRCLMTTWAAVKAIRTLPVRYSVWAMLAAIPVAVIGVVMHNLIYAITDAEEPFFFILAIFGAPLLFVAGLLGAVIPRGHRPPPAGTSLQPR